MRNHSHKLQQWQQNLKQQFIDYDEYMKKLKNKEKELVSSLSQLEHELNKKVGHLEGISNLERAANMEARKENLLKQMKTMEQKEQDMRATYNNLENQYSDNCTDEVSMKDAIKLAYYRMLGLLEQETEGSTHRVKSVSHYPPNVERLILTDNMSNLDSAKKIWNSLGR